MKRTLHLDIQIADPKCSFFSNGIHFKYHQNVVSGFLLSLSLSSFLSSPLTLLYHSELIFCINELELDKWIVANVKLEAEEREREREREMEIGEKELKQVLNTNFNLANLW